jgi:hypothetical protein
MMQCDPEWNALRARDVEHCAGRARVEGKQQSGGEEENHRESICLTNVFGAMAR